MMRLTLRTLLAYMDDILEPTDHEELGKKIEASDFATELIHRSRDAVRRLRLGAPELDAGSDADDVLGGISVSDANAVADYIDNTLPPQEVAEFERMCLEPGTEADMHLAEVASCHHILTMVLGEPAETDNRLKDRIYRLPDESYSSPSTQVESGGQKLRIEPAHQHHQTSAMESPIEAAPPAAVSPVSAPEATEPSPTSEVPDYLRAASAARGRSQQRLLAIAALLFIGFVSWFLWPTTDELPPEIAGKDEQELTGELDIEMTPAVPLEAETPPEEPAGEEPASDTTTAQEDQESNSELSVPPLETEVDPIEETIDPIDELPGPVTDNDLAPPMEEDPFAEQFGSLDEIDDGTSDVIEPDETMNLSVNSTLPGTLEIPAQPDVLEGTQEPTEDEPLNETPDNTTVVAETIDLEPEPEPEPEPQGPVQLGNYIGHDDVLLSLDAQSGQWSRLPLRSPLFTGDTLLNLPKYRTHVVLEDFNIYMSGGTRVEFPTAKDNFGSQDADLAFTVAHGRLLLNAGLNGKRMALKFGQEIREFQLESSGSLAVEVKRMFVPGNDFEIQSPVEANWYLTHGTLVWPNANGGEEVIQAPASWNTIEGIDGLPDGSVKTPEWIGRERLTYAEQRAVTKVSEELGFGEPVGLRFLELTDESGLGRQEEVRTLAAQASLYVGIYEPAVQALNDSELSRTWATQIEALQQAMARSPEVAEKVRQAFINMRGEAAADDFIELLQGYSAEEIGKTREERQTGALVKLLKWLESESLDYRVLANHNLNAITGKTSVEGYRPSGSPSRRKIAVRKIWSRFEKGDLVLRP